MSKYGRSIATLGRVGNGRAIATLGRLFTEEQVTDVNNLFIKPTATMVAKNKPLGIMVKC